MYQKLGFISLIICTFAMVRIAIGGSPDVNVTKAVYIYTKALTLKR